LKIRIDGHVFEVELERHRPLVDGRIHRFRSEKSMEGAAITVYVDGEPFDVEVAAGDPDSVIVNGQTRRVQMLRDVPSTAPRARRAVPAPPTTVPGGVCASISGKVIGVAVATGQTVKVGDLLVTIEAMKLRNEILSPYEGTIKEVRVRSDDMAKTGDLLVVVE
jgi:biotin carboxyl carrier protein